MTHQEMWRAFRAEHPAAADDYEAWAFGESPDELAELVRIGRKTATASAYAVYSVAGESLPRPGDYSVILNSQEEAVCIIRNIRVDTLPFREVPAEFAYREGEGDRSLGYWRRVHEAFFTRELADCGLAFSPDMPVVLEEFEVVWK